MVFSWSAAVEETLWGAGEVMMAKPREEPVISQSLRCSAAVAPLPVLR